MFIFSYADLSGENAWEYGEIARNVIDGKGYSLFYIEENDIKFEYDPEARPWPSAYMPPGYVALLVPFMAIGNDYAGMAALFVFQGLLHLLTIIFIYNFTKITLGNAAAIASGGILALLPEFIYASSVAGTTAVYHLLAAAILIALMFFDDKIPRRTAIIIAIFFAVLIYFRSEAIVLFGIYILFLLIKNRPKIAIISAFIVFFAVLPWTARNYLVFDEFVPMSNSGGLNFYRGHNPYFPGSWGDEEIRRELINAAGPDFELRMNDIYRDHAIRHIANDPLGEIPVSFEKIIHLWIYDPYDSRTRHPLYLWPWIIVLILSIYGIIKAPRKRRFMWIYIFLAYHTLLAVAFFAIPRYQTMMKFALLPFAGYGLTLLVDRFLSRQRK